jgi:hypothetical protein
VFATFEQYLSLDDLRDIMEASTYEAIRASVSGATREEVLAAAQAKAAELVTNVSATVRQQLAETIATGLEEQKGVEATARELRDNLGLDANRQAQLDNYKAELQEQGLSASEIEDLVEKRKDELIADRAMTISQNEIGKAIEAGAFDNARGRGATHKVWIPVFAGNVCEDCLANAEQGPIGINDSFGSGDDFGQAHPNCHCTVAYLTDMGGGEIDRARDRAIERVGKIKDAIDAETEEE